MDGMHNKFNIWDFLKKNGMTLFVSFSVLALMVVLAVLFAVSTKKFMELELKSRLENIAAVTAQQFSADELWQIQNADDADDPAYKEIVKKLYSIQHNSLDVLSVYLMRRTGNPDILEIIATSDAGLSFHQTDKNKNGIVDPDEQPALPGDLFDTTKFPVINNQAFRKPSTDEDIGSEKGEYIISGYAPVWDTDGIAVAIVGVDISAERNIALRQGMFSPAFHLLIVGLALLVTLSVIVLFWKNRAELLNQINQERGALLRLTMHQLNAPLTTFKWWREIWEDRDLNGEAQEIMSNLNEGVERLEYIIESLKQAELISLGELEYKPEELSLNNLLDDIVTDYQPLAENQKQHIRLCIGDDQQIHADPKLIGGVFRELLDNALVYSSEYTTITVICTKKKGIMQVSVEDQGHGIPAADITHIFDRFVRGGNAKEFKPHGTGVGLFTSKRIIEQAGGNMWVKSTEGKGSTFFFTLPL